MRSVYSRIERPFYTAGSGFNGVFRREQKISSSQSCGSTGQHLIPPVIAKANPGLSEARYGVLRDHPVFLYKTVPLCESCCTERNNTMLAELAAQNPASAQGEEPRGGRRLGVPSLAGALRRMGAADKASVR